MTTLAYYLQETLFQLNPLVPSDPKVIKSILFCRVFFRQVLINGEGFFGKNRLYCLDAMIKIQSLLIIFIPSKGKCT